MPGHPLPPTASDSLDSFRRSFPGGFALVMATGIVSVALDGQGHGLVAHALFGINLAAYALFCVAGVARITAAPHAVAGRSVTMRAGRRS